MSKSSNQVLRVLVLSSYSQMGASSRIRMYQYESALKQFNIECTFSPLLGESHLVRRYQEKRVSAWQTLGTYWRRVIQLRHSSEFDLVWLERELFPWLPYAVEAMFLPGKAKYIVEYDDAIFHRYDQHKSRLIRFVFGQKIAQLMRKAKAVIAGNKYIADYASASGAGCCVTIPTVIDMTRYEKNQHVERTDNVLRVGWIGTPVTAPYLGQISSALQRLGASHKVELHVIGGVGPDISGVTTNNIQWDSDSEAELICAFDVGVMPLPDAEWERGKCGYKLIQYMGCGLPVVASPVGVNAEIVREGVNGFLARDSEDWYQALKKLATDSGLRQTMGRQGRDIVEREYSLQATAPKLAAVLREAVT